MSIIYYGIIVGAGNRTIILTIDIKVSQPQPLDDLLNDK